MLASGPRSPARSARASSSSSPERRSSGPRLARDGLMRIAACILGVVGALVGIFFAQLLVTVSMVLSLATSQTGDVELGIEFFLGAGALLFFALGMAGAIVTPIRAALGTILLLMSAVGRVVAILAIGGPGPTAISNGATLAAVVPYLGSALLF